MKRSLLFALVLTVLGSASLVGCTPSSEDGEAGFPDWAREHLVPLEAADLSAAVGDARLVGLGESRHDTREQFLAKGTLVRKLVEEREFRALLLEESLPHAPAIDRWIRGGEGELDDAMQAIAGWYLWDVEEMHGLFRWMRTFNEGRPAEDQVRVFGVDISAPASGVREVLAALEAAGIDAGLNEEMLGLELQEGDFWPTTWERYRGLVEERRAELRANYEALVEASRQLEDPRMLLLAEIGQRGNTLFLTSSLEEGGDVRESGMSAATLWFLENEIPDQRAILWAHNLHVAKATFEMPGLAEGTLTPMGVSLAEALGDDYLAIGAAFGSGRFDNNPDNEDDDTVFELQEPDVLDGALARAGEGSFLLDLREAPEGSPASAWLSQARPWLAQGGSAEIVVRDALDLVYFVDEISRATPSERARARLQSLTSPR